METVMLHIKKNDLLKKLTIIDNGKTLVCTPIEDGIVVNLTSILCYQKAFVLKVMTKLRDMKIKKFYFDINDKNTKYVDEYETNNHCLAKPLNWSSRIEDKKLVFEFLS